MTKFAWAWVWLGFLVALDIAIPWFVLTRVEKMSGAFLFWTIWAAAAVASVFIILRRWREVER
jgi:hypothetical protein